MYKYYDEREEARIMITPRVEQKTFAQKARMIYLSQIKKRENEELLNLLLNSPARQETVIIRLRENEAVIKCGEKELEELIAINLSRAIREVYKHTTDAEKRKQFIKEGSRQLRHLLSNYDYSDVKHFNDDLQGFLADFSVYMERSSQ